MREAYGSSSKIPSTRHNPSSKRRVRSLLLEVLEAGGMTFCWARWLSQHTSSGRPPALALLALNYAVTVTSVTGVSSVRSQLYRARV